MEIFKDKSKAEEIRKFLAGLVELTPPEFVEGPFYRMIDNCSEELASLLTDEGKVESERVSDKIDFYEWLRTVEA